MSEDNCPICKDVFNDKVMHEPCGHEFCKSCLDRWYEVSRKKICPFCRQTEEENDNIYFSEEEDEEEEERQREERQRQREEEERQREERQRQEILDRENNLTFNRIYNLEDVYSDPNFKDLSYESTIYLQTIDKINEYYNDINGYYTI